MLYISVLYVNIYFYSDGAVFKDKVIQFFDFNCVQNDYDKNMLDKIHLLKVFYKKMYK
jgi:hypothetical protein